MTGRRPKLVLHFDVRNTVLVADSISNVSVEQALNSYLTSVAWGRVQDDTWSWYPDPKPSLQKPSPCCISYYKYSENTHVQGSSDRVRFRRLLGDFTQTDIGRPFLPVFEKTLKLLEYPYPVHPHFIMQGSNGKNYHYILPSFLNLLTHLCDKDEDFKIIFRTYGLDASNVLLATDLMLKGSHPAYPRKFPVRVDHEIGRLVRQSHGISFHKQGRLINDERQIYRLLTDDCPRVSAVVDDFHWWMKNRYHHSAGKPLWIDLEDPDALHIFFDDNIRLEEEDSIVDVRVLSGTAPVLQRHLVQVDLLAAVSDAAYFVKCLERCRTPATANGCPACKLESDVTSVA